jgi:hypothetical protein
MRRGRSKESLLMPESLPQSVRYVKNGSGGKWWEAAKARGQVHCGWWFVPRDLLHRLDLPEIKACIQGHYKKPGVVTADFNAFNLVAENPSRHIWITFEDGCLWWCTVRDGITVNLDVDREKTEGSFWLTCTRPWSNRSVGGKLLVKSSLPGIVGAVAGFRAMICEPKGSPEILRIIQDKEDQDAYPNLRQRPPQRAQAARGRIPRRSRPRSAPPPSPDRAGRDAPSATREGSPKPPRCAHNSSPGREERSRWPGGPPDAPQAHPEQARSGLAGRHSREIRRESHPQTNPVRRQRQGVSRLFNESGYNTPTVARGCPFLQGGMKGGERLLKPRCASLQLRRTAGGKLRRWRTSCVALSQIRVWL